MFYDNDTRFSDSSGSTFSLLRTPLFMRSGGEELDNERQFESPPASSRFSLLHRFCCWTITELLPPNYCISLFTYFFKVRCWKPVTYIPASSCSCWWWPLSPTTPAVLVLERICKQGPVSTADNDGWISGGWLCLPVLCLWFQWLCCFCISRILSSSFTLRKERRKPVTISPTTITTVRDPLSSPGSKKRKKFLNRQSNSQSNNRQQLISELTGIVTGGERESPVVISAASLVQHQQKQGFLIRGCANSCCCSPLPDSLFQSVSSPTTAAAADAIATAAITAQFLLIPDSLPPPAETGWPGLWKLQKQQFIMWVNLKECFLLHSPALCIQDLDPLSHTFSSSSSPSSMGAAAAMQPLRQYDTVINIRIRTGIPVIRILPHSCWSQSPGCTIPDAATAAVTALIHVASVFSESCLTDAGCCCV